MLYHQMVQENQSNDSIVDVKKKLEDKQGIPLKKQDLIYDGQPLEDEKCLDDYGIPDTATLDLKSSLRIFAQPEKGSPIALSVKPTDKIADIKHKIDDKETIPAKQQRLLYDVDIIHCHIIRFDYCRSK